MGLGAVCYIHQQPVYFISTTFNIHFNFGFHLLVHTTSKRSDIVAEMELDSAPVSSVLPILPVHPYDRAWSPNHLVAVSDGAVHNCLSD
jgi:hypothetical protein